MRKPMVTRTITTTIAKVLCVNPSTRALEEVDFTLPRTYKTEQDILKKIDKIGMPEDKAGLKPVSVVSTDIKAQLYKLPEEDFVKYATPTDASDPDVAENDEAPVNSEN